jgi:ABC-2 type transport system permease protein
MTSILKKEFNSFFSSSIAYLVIGVFLLMNGLFLWVFDDDFNILNAGFADLNSFFYISPWILLFLIPAITMKMFSDEFQTGTIEILQTQPITNWHIVLGKFFASLLLVIIAIAPTFVYVYSISELANPVGNIDLGSILGSYLGLILLAATYAAVGLFTSTLSKNQIVAFILGIFIVFLIYYGFDAAASLFGEARYQVQLFGMNEHFKSISRGVIDTRDLLYFVSVIGLFLFVTQQQLIQQKKNKYVAFLVIGLLILNFGSQHYYQRFDFTQDQRYTLSDVTKNILDNIDGPMSISVYLEGEFPTEFKRLQIESRQFLEELKAENSKIRFQFIDPVNQRDRLVKAGMFPSQLTVEEDGKLSNALIFPWAEIFYGNKRTIVPLLPDGILQSQEQQLEAAIESLEYSFSNGIKKVTQERDQKIAVLKGNGELDDLFLTSLLTEVAKKYKLAPITLDSIEKSPQAGINVLNNFDLAIIAKPTEVFTEKEKLVLDQFVMHGGKSLWLLENTQADTDSLQNNGKMLAYPRDLNLTDLLFSYGVRINTQLIQDLYAANIRLATGNIGNQPQFQNLPWFYDPLVRANPQHPITKNVLPVRLRFANQIDTLKNSIKKTPLLVSSPLTRKIGTPTFIELQSISQEPKQEQYQGGYQLFGVLLEGEFTSMYANRIKPFDTNNYQQKSSQNKMIVISDGDVAKNQIAKNQPYDLSVDKWTGERFGNKEFLLNSIDYLLDDTGLINLRNKTLQINLLDKQRAYEQRSYWQFLNVVVPLILLGVFGFVFFYWRKRKYA